MNNITIKDKNKYIKTIKSNNYFVIGQESDKVHMCTNLNPEDLLLLLFPFLEYLEKCLEKNIYE